MVLASQLPLSNSCQKWVAKIGPSLNSSASISAGGICLNMKILSISFKQSNVLSISDEQQGQATKSYVCHVK